MIRIALIAATATLTAAALSAGVSAGAMSPTPIRNVVVYHTNEAATQTKVAHDASGRHNDGQLINVTTGVSGDNGGNSWRLGDDPEKHSYVKVPDSPSINPDVRNFSYTVRWRINTPINILHDLRLVQRGSSSHSGADVKMELKYAKDRSGSVLECAFRDQQNKSAALYHFEGRLTRDVWHTTTCTKKAHSIEMVDDGKLHTKAVWLGNMTSTSPIYLGIERTGPNTWHEQFTGNIDDVLVTIGS